MSDDLPGDLARPREEMRERASFLANLIVGGALIALCAGMLLYVGFVG